MGRASGSKMGFRIIFGGLKPTATKFNRAYGSKSIFKYLCINRSVLNDDFRKIRTEYLKLVLNDNKVKIGTKKFGEPQRDSPKYITNTPKYSYEFKY
ncbi:hypothetical protein LV89_00715 [Arcicella aurantiaca]|uniref:Uncharacterized protein n=1 Tax=Arcicella aurantiaca TaxID=591202 RepID=A0A316EE87_9BACT|nr:hypothetical protein [Arcicella aurantiaca]PWK28511.1 hypothetical protein LV89_00715 [Arcicella aurantiaca]